MVPKPSHHLDNTADNCHYPYSCRSVQSTVAGRSSNYSAVNKSELTAMVRRAVERMRSSLGSGHNIAFALLSAQETGNYTLRPDEASILSPHASQTKKERFARGRTAAHLALQQLGIEKSPPILRGQEGEPLWPIGVAGSITHCGLWTIVVVAKGPKHFSLGVDLESYCKINHIDISGLVCCDKELDWVTAGNDFRKRLASIFSAKEAAYKALYPVCNRYIDFKEVELSPLSPEKGFRGQFCTSISDQLTPGYSFQIQCHWLKDLIFSYVVHAAE